MTPLNLDLLNKVWDGIKSGELEHNQEDFFCGAAACLAGWICAFEARAKYPKAFDLYLEDGNLEAATAIYSGSYDYNYWNHAARIVGLTDLEAFLLFHMGATIEAQGKVIRALNAGKRFYIPSGVERGHIALYEYHEIVTIAGL